MPLPTDDAALRELNRKCANRNSLEARRTVRQLLALPLAGREYWALD
jgi:hypothetical protein